MKLSTLFIAVILSFMFIFITNSVQAEQIFGVTFTEEEVTFLVKSTGCTDSKSFELIKPDLNSKTPVIGIKRIAEDTCKAMSKIIKLTYKLSDFGIEGPINYIKVDNAFKNNLH